MTNYRTKKWFDFFMILTVFFTMFVMSTMASVERPNSTTWNGIQGVDSLKCSLVGQEERTEDGWIHWIFNQADSVTEPLLVLGGSGTGEYLPSKLSGPTYHFFTPYFDHETLTATVWYDGTHDGEFVISDYCPGIPKEELTVSKTVETSYNRTHDWSIAKTVDKDVFRLFVDGSGDGKATWTVNVTYLGYADADYNVKGTITIENTGDLDAVITSVDDVLGGTPIMVDCGVTFPYTLVEEAVLTCTYDENGKFMGNNVVTVITERDEYSDTKAIIWGTPDKEYQASVVVKDLSDLFGEVTLATLYASDYTKDDVIPFTYDKEFTWVSYGQDACGIHMYENTATVYGDDHIILDYDTADVTVYVQCLLYETAFAKGTNSRCFLQDGFSRWGWTNKLALPGTYTMPVYAGAGQCIGGTYVGDVTVSYIGTTILVNFDLDPMFVKETHVYAGKAKYPVVKVGKKSVPTVAPGQYYIEPNLNGEIWVIFHAVVGIPDPDFGK